MTKQENTPVFDSKKYSDQVGDLVTKITSGKLSKEQIKFFDMLDLMGFDYIVGYGATDASKKILEYFSKNP